MKSTGIVRRVDELGRIVIPKELRRTLDIDEGDPMGIYVDGDRIILIKHQVTCLFCDSTDDISTFKGKPVCKTCLQEIKG